MMSSLDPTQIKTLLIDLDDTLYPQTSGIWDMIRMRINQFLYEEMGFPAKDVPELRHRLWQQYGTTLRGLQTEFTVDMAFYLDYVHDIPLESILKSNPQLDHILQGLPQRKVIFTNAYAPHAKRVTDLLGISDQIERIIDIYALSPFCKPEVEAFNKALELIDEIPEHCVLIDDSPGNISMAQSLGMGTISVGLYSHDNSPHIDSINDLASILSPH